LLFDVFQTSTAKAPRNRQNAQSDRLNDSRTHVAAGGPKFLSFNVAAAVSDVPVSLHLEDTSSLASDADYLVHFNVPGIPSAGLCGSGAVGEHALMQGKFALLSGRGAVRRSR
jgi:hypothetical protein